MMYNEKLGEIEQSLSHSAKVLRKLAVHIPASNREEFQEAVMQVDTAVAVLHTESYR